MITQMAQKAKSIKNAVRRELVIVNPDAAGIDVSSTNHQVCVPEDRDENHNQSFGCFTEDLHKIARWLLQCKISTVAMEATGIYWVQLYMVLEEYGLDVILVNARHIKNIAGKKTDVVDASWIQLLHSYGLLTASFQPENMIRQIRQLTRQRESLIKSSSREVLHMQKALEQMNIKLHKVISDLLGKSGMAILKAIIVQGIRTASELAQYADHRIKATQQEIIKSLEGNWAEDQMFILKQSYELYNFYQQKINECDGKIDQFMQVYGQHKPSADTHYHPSGKRKKQKNDLKFDAEHYLFRAFGVNITRIPGICQLSGIKLLAELGGDFVQKFPSFKQFTSWANVVPNNKISGGRLLSSYVSRKKNKVGSVLRTVASALKQNRSPLGEYFRKVQARHGYAQAVVATANKIARILYTMVKEKTEYDPAKHARSSASLSKQIQSLERRLQMLKMHQAEYQQTTG
jgi:transposase